MASNRRRPSKLKGVNNNNRPSVEFVLRKGVGAGVNTSNNDQKKLKILDPLPAVSVSVLQSDVRRSQLGASVAENAVKPFTDLLQEIQNFEAKDAARAAHVRQQNTKWRQRYELQSKLNDFLRDKADEIERHHEMVLSLVDSHIQKFELQEERKRVEQLIREEREHRYIIDQHCLQEYDALRELMHERSDAERKIMQDISKLDYDLEQKTKYATSPRTRLSQLPEIPLTSRADDSVLGEEQLLMNEISRLDGVLLKFSQANPPAYAPPSTRSSRLVVTDDNEAAIMKELHNLDELLVSQNQAAVNLPEKLRRSRNPIPLNKLMPRKVDWLTYYKLSQPKKVNVFIH